MHHLRLITVTEHEGGTAKCIHGGLQFIDKAFETDIRGGQHRRGGQPVDNEQRRLALPDCRAQKFHEPGQALFFEAVKAADIIQRVGDRLAA